MVADMPDPLACELTLQPSGEPVGVILSSRPERVAVRILSEGEVFYAGKALASRDCDAAIQVPLASVDEAEP